MQGRHNDNYRFAGNCYHCFTVLDRNAVQICFKSVISQFTGQLARSAMTMTMTMTAELVGTLNTTGKGVLGVSYQCGREEESEEGPYVRPVHAQRACVAPSFVCTGVQSPGPSNQNNRQNSIHCCRPADLSMSQHSAQSGGSPLGNIDRMLQLWTSRKCPKFALCVPCVRPVRDLSHTWS